MINFEEELAKFKPSMEIGEAEEKGKAEHITDLTDIMIQLMSQNVETNREKK